MNKFTFNYKDVDGNLVTVTAKTLLLAQAAAWRVTKAEGHITDCHHFKNGVKLKGTWDY